jgi:hypothetical protein
VFDAPDQPFTTLLQLIGEQPAAAGASQPPGVEQNGSHDAPLVLAHCPHCVQASAQHTLRVQRVIMSVINNRFGKKHTHTRALLTHPSTEQNPDEH